MRLLLIGGMCDGERAPVDEYIRVGESFRVRVKDVIHVHPFPPVTEPNPLCSAETYTVESIQVSRHVSILFGRHYALSLENAIRMLIHGYVGISQEVKQ